MTPPYEAAASLPGSSAPNSRPPNRFKDKFAQPFIPYGPNTLKSYGYPNYTGFASSVSGSVGSQDYSYLLNIAKLSNSVSEQNLQELIDSIIESNFDENENSYYNVVKFYEEPNSKDSIAEDDPENEYGAILEVSSWALCTKLIENLNGYEWLSKILDVKLISSPLVNYMMLNQRNSGTNGAYYNPYFPSIPPQHSWNQHDIYSESNSPATEVPSAPGVSPHTNVSQPSAESLPSAANMVYDYSSYGHASPFPTMSLQYPLQPPPAPPAMGKLGSLGASVTISQPSRYLPRRSSSNRSFESKRSSRSNSSTALSSVKTSVSSNSSIASGVTGTAKQPVPAFIMNMVNKNRSESLKEMSGDTPTEAESEHLSDNESDPADDNFMLIKNNDDEEMIRVNACRLFIGNVPYSSTWAHLKDYLSNKSRELDPESNVSILRVEIPIQSGGHSQPIQPPLGRGPLSTDELMLAEHGIDPSMMPQSQTVNYPKSRGFAIVTTANKASSDKLIELFDNADFEGRSLTVRYDKYPEYNNYVLQQMYPSGNRNGSGSGIIAHTRNNRLFATSVINHLAFERNSIQQKFYYGSSPNPANTAGYMMYPYYYSNVSQPTQLPSKPTNSSVPATLPPIPQQYYQYPSYTSVYPRSSQVFQSDYRSPKPTPLSNHNQIDKKSESKVEAKPGKPRQEDPEYHGIINEDQRARDLVNSFKDMDLASK